MELFIYSMYDRLDGCHRALVTARSDARASRDFVDQLKDAYKKNPAAVNLADFELHKLGSYDDVSGVIKPLDRPEVLPLDYGSSDKAPPSDS